MNMTIGSPVQRFRRPILSQLLDALIRDPVEKEENRHTLSLLSALLQDAARENASDVHLDPVEGSYQLRFRMDGALIDTLELALSDGERLVLEIQTLGNDDVARVTHVFGDKTIELSIEWASGFGAKVQGRAED